jgi:pimeloyl-ACP methyl ester carboxylesterase
MQPGTTPQGPTGPGRGDTAGPDTRRREVHAGFDLGAPDGGPFPSNHFTIADPTQNTGLRVNLPLPDPTTNLSDYQDTQLLDTLDGFNLQPRLSIPFDGPIDVNSVSSDTVFLVSLGDTLNPHDHGGQVVGVNQVVQDVATTTLHVQSDQVLDQHTRYALLVTDGVQDQRGHPVGATEAFRHFRQTVQGPYRHELEDAVRAARRLGIPERDLVTASVFTTQSATAVLEKIRDQIHAATPEPADFNLGLDGTRTVFSLDAVRGITFNEQTGDNPPRFTPTELDTGLLHILPGAVGTVAFGKFVSPDYEVHPGEYIPQVGTRTGTPVVQSRDEVYFNLFLPSGPRPEGGWPVAIYGHGGGSNKNDFGTFVAASLAAQGIATIGINMPGCGFGPLGTLVVRQADGSPVTLPAGGRSFDQDGSGTIDSQEGFFAASPRSILWSRDSLRQAAADLMQLVRVIQAGVDVTGDTPDLDPSRIYYFGQSSGAQLATIFLATEPDVKAGVINSGFGPFIDTNRLSYGARTFRQTRIEPSIQARMPSLSNPPGVVNIAGLAVGTGVFNENLPLRNGVPLEVRLSDGTSQTIRSPVVNTVAGAMEIQKVFDDTVWLSMAGDALGYAPHLRRSPLPGVPAKSLIVSFGKGDEAAPNPMETAVVRAGDLADRVTFYRNDLAFAEDGQVPKNPHRFMTDVNDTDPLAVQIALGAQQQVATFFASDGQTIIQPEPARFFETPIQGPLPEDFSWIP